MPRLAALVPLLCALLALPVLLPPAPPPAGAAKADADTPVAPTTRAFTHFYGYVEAVGRGDLDRAATFWRPEDLAAASRLGITHPDPLLKVDSDSPLWRVQSTLLDTTLADYKFGPAVELKAGPLAGNIVLLLRVYEGAQRLAKQYFFQPDGQGGLLLASQARWLAEQGPGTPGRYVTVFERRPDRSWDLPPHLLPALDGAVAQMAARLQLPADRLAVLAEQKLHYLLAHPTVVEALAGAPTVGVANLQVDMVITHHPWHAHELAHLLVNVWLENPPLYALPLLQEGLATHLGGRWGRHARVLDRVGRAAWQAGLVTLDDLLTRSAFFGQPADLTYAPAGVFCGFLLDEFGPRALREAYLAGSGTLDEVAGWSVAEAQDRLGGALGAPWERIAARFAAYLAAGPQLEPGLRPVRGDALWADDGAGAGEPVAADAGTGDAGTPAAARPTVAAVRWEAPDGALGISVLGREGAPRAAILAGGADPTGADHAPALFAEHLPDRPYRGESHLLLLDSAEARLYDLRTETLIALHSEGFWPTAGTDAPYVRRGGRGVCVQLAAGLAVPRDGWRLVDLAADPE